MSKTQLRTHQQRQEGIALIFLVFFLGVISTAIIIQHMDSSNIPFEREKATIAALNEAKQALIGASVSSVEITTPLSLAAPKYFPRYLLNPDLRLSSSIREGSESGNAGAADISLIGKLPWYSLGVSTFKDGWQECLWYIVSGRFKHSPPTAILNWDTQGQLEVIDSSGNLIASNLVAIIASVGPILEGQNRSTNTNLPNCGGNYDAKNYLDTPNINNANHNTVNYFLGTTNNRQALNTNNKQFVFAKDKFYNDQFVYITSEDIFRPLMFRDDFINQISVLINETHLSSISLSGAKGTDNIDCSKVENTKTKTDEIFCNNWKEMLLIKDFNPPISMSLEGSGSNLSCNRVIFFGGKRTVSQSRLSATDKGNPDNYLENENLTVFKTQSGSLKGFAKFNPANASADVMKCL